ncbi:jg10351 [Pararge aegeria aegeria]|uniref:Jg10351 protein n=1 Tax=Pararge aegeria aegeria TaxID=348720 RepID=A0A8S4SP12_9NEOP|nr:jg10351 [Pararge aegeria aegeria]
MSVLIDIIQKIEDNPNVSDLVDLRQLSVLLLQRYRQDGIEYHQPESTVAASTNVLPFAPTFHSFYRNKLLLSRILPVNLRNLANDTVNSTLKCALHRMVSTTVDARVRGDENNCNQLSQYRALRTARSLRDHLLKDDFEMLDVAALNSAKTNGQMRQFNPNDEVEFSNYNHNELSERQVLVQSQCPLLDGVVSTRWGAVSAGNVIAGIAAGAQPQTIPITELAKGSIINQPNIQSFVTALYPATLSGDLAEAVLIQNTERGSQTISVGTAGSWNSTQAHRFFMLQTPNGLNNIEMTDPEIRGDIDGFVLGSTITTLLQSVSSIRLSQVLDMYYTARNGVLDPARRACNRQTLSQEVIPYATLAAETLAFTAALDTNMPLRGTIIGGLEQPVNSAVSNFQTYARSNLNDLNCAETEVNTHDFRIKTNLYLVVDASWQYQTIYPAISYLLDKIEVGKYGSSVTLLNAFDGSIQINKTFSLADFHTGYTMLTHQSMLSGVNLDTAFKNITLMMHNELDTERTANYIGGNSTVLLFLINSGVQTNSGIVDQARILNETVPDLRILFATSSNQLDALWPLVREMHNDVLTISLSSDGTNVERNMNSVLSRIELVGRRIINPACGSNYPDGTSGRLQFVDYVEPGYINYYSISPNYFHLNNDNRRVRISRSTAGVGTMVICQSRTLSQPRQTNTSVGSDTSDVTCQTMPSSGTREVEINLRGACDEHSPINSCQFFHISVQSVLPSSSVATYFTDCTERGCRFPYNIRYQVQIEEFGCFSGCGSTTISLTLLLLAFIYNFL